MSCSSRMPCSQRCTTVIRRGRPALDGIPVLAATDQAFALASTLLSAAAMPRKAAVDAAHVAVAAINGLEFLLTWNCAHIANATMRPRIERVCRDAGFEPPTICTPEELRAEENR